jgi:hypothetical protein
MPEYKGAVLVGMLSDNRRKPRRSGANPIAAPYLSRSLWPDRARSRTRRGSHFCFPFVA